MVEKAINNLQADFLLDDSSLTIDQKLISFVNIGENQFVVHSIVLAKVFIHGGIYNYCSRGSFSLKFHTRNCHEVQQTLKQWLAEHSDPKVKNVCI